MSLSLLAACTSSEEPTSGGSTGNNSIGDLTGGSASGISTQIFLKRGRSTQLVFGADVSFTVAVTQPGTVESERARIIDLAVVGSNANYGTVEPAIEPVLEVRLQDPEPDDFALIITNGDTQRDLRGNVAIRPLSPE